MPTTVHPQAVGALVQPGGPFFLFFGPLVTGFGSKVCVHYILCVQYVVCVQCVLCVCVQLTEPQVFRTLLDLHPVNKSM